MIDDGSVVWHYAKGGIMIYLADEAPEGHQNPVDTEDVLAKITGIG